MKEVLRVPVSGCDCPNRTVCVRGAHCQPHAYEPLMDNPFTPGLSYLARSLVAHSLNTMVLGPWPNNTHSVERDIESVEHPARTGKS